MRFFADNGAKRPLARENPCIAPPPESQPQKLSQALGQSFVIEGKPGGLNYASSGPGTPYHMAGELLKAMAGVDVVHVPYKGSSGARTSRSGRIVKASCAKADR